jgi:hypothetical protein
VKFNRKERKVLRKVLKAAKNISHWSFFEAVKFNCKRHKDVSQVQKEKLKCPYMPPMFAKLLRLDINVNKFELWSEKGWEQII